MNVLITGSDGFIAYHLRQRLSSHNLTLIDKKSGINCNEDLHELFEKGKFDLVFHLAANSDISTSDPLVDYEDTFCSTLNILQNCRIHNVPEFIFASSSAIYGNVRDKIKEETFPKPISHYGAAKLAAEAFIRSYCYNYGIRMWIFRFPNVVGSHATHGVLYDLVRKHKENPDKLTVLGTGEQRKPYIHVSELIDLMLYLYKDRKEWVNDYNIAPETTTSVKEIAEMITSGGIEYTGESWLSDVQRYEYDIKKLKRTSMVPKMTSNEAVELAIKELRDDK